LLKRILMNTTILARSKFVGATKPRIVNFRK
jgi:hypothetical protein